MISRRVNYFLPLSCAALLTALGCDPLASVCQRSSDCERDELCVSRRCRPVCNTSADCSGGELCAEGACLPALVRDAAVAPDQTSQERGRLDAREDDRRVPDAAPRDLGPPDQAPADFLGRPDVATGDRAVVDRAAALDTVSLGDAAAPSDAVVAEDSRSGEAGVTTPDAGTGDAAVVDTGALDVVSAPTCGDGRVESPETCDDGNRVDGDGCSGACEIEPGWRCDVYNPVSGSICAEQCGDGLIVGAEVCDGANLAGETCTSQGFLPGVGPTTCRDDCRAFDIAACGSAIHCSNVQLAIDSASHATEHQVISLPSMDCTLSRPLVIDQCGLPVCLFEPAGITLRPLDGPVLFRSSSRDDCITVRTGRNVIEYIEFEDCGDAVALDDLGPFSGSNTVRHNRIVNIGIVPRVPLRVLSAGNIVLGNWIENRSPSDGSDAIRVEGVATQIVLNVVYGDFRAAVRVKNLSNITIDSNTLWAASPLGATTGMSAIELSDVQELCLRNNLLVGDGDSNGYDLSGAVGFSLSCPGGESSHNAVSGFLRNCKGTFLLCNTLCDNGPLCDVAAPPPVISASACLVSGSPLVDRGLLLAYDKVDLDPALYLGAAPDLGALESGARYRFGDQSFVCP